MARSHQSRSRSWDPVAKWYIRWVGKKGSEHHRQFAIPVVMELLNPRPGENILDIGCGPGLLSTHIARSDARYTGIDASSKMIRFARHNFGGNGIFLLADATRLAEVAGLHPGSFDGIVFMLSIQDINPLDEVIQSATWALRRGGRVVVFMTHPCFRVPWYSSWERDRRHGRHFRRIDRYLNTLALDMRPYPRGRGSTRTYHRPLESYVSAMATHGFLIDRMKELPAPTSSEKEQRAPREGEDNEEIPLFLAIRAVKV